MSINFAPGDLRTVPAPLAPSPLTSVVFFHDQPETTRQHANCIQHQPKILVHWAMKTKNTTMPTAGPMVMEPSSLPKGTSVPPGPDILTESARA